MNPVQIHRIVFAVGLPEPHSYNHSAENPTAEIFAADIQNSDAP